MKTGIAAQATCTTHLDEAVQDDVRADAHTGEGSCVADIPITYVRRVKPMRGLLAHTLFSEEALSGGGRELEEVTFTIRVSDWGGVPGMRRGGLR